MNLGLTTETTETTELKEMFGTPMIICNAHTEVSADIEEIIRKAQEPLQKQIEEMKRQQEKHEEERKWDNMQI